MRPILIHPAVSCPLHALGNCCVVLQLKAVIVDTNLNVLNQAEVKFDTDLPEFRTIGGVNAGKNKNE